MSSFDSPFFLQAINFAGKQLHRFGINVCDLDSEKLVRKAMRKTGLKDLGEDDHQTALNILIDSLRNDVNLNFFGELMAYHTLVRSLRNRLLFIQELKNNPGIEKIPLKPMIVIASMPRTGTTLLHRLLAQDPGAISLPLWVLVRPIHLKTSSKNPTKQKIYQIRARFLLRLIRILSFQLDIKHEVRSDQPDECNYLFMNCLRSTQFSAFWPVVSYMEWLFEQDPLPMYSFYRKNLQLLQKHMKGEHWVLKSPMHFCYMSALMEMFPEARIVMLHRDPRRIIPSLLSLYTTIYNMSTNNFDMRQLASSVMRFLAKFSEDIVDIRRVFAPDRFCDIQYMDLVRNPVEMVQQIYETFNMAWSGKLLLNLKSYIHSNPKDKYGKHEYTLDRYGLKSNEIYDCFRKYIERFHPLPE